MINFSLLDKYRDKPAHFMTKKQLMEILQDVDDDTEIVFRMNYNDYGYFDCDERMNGVNIYPVEECDNPKSVIIRLSEVYYYG